MGAMGQAASCWHRSLVSGNGLGHTTTEAEASRMARHTINAPMALMIIRRLEGGVGAALQVQLARNVCIPTLCLMHAQNYS